MTHDTTPAPGHVQIKYLILVFNRMRLRVCMTLGGAGSIFHLVYLQQHISPGLFAERLVVNIAVVYTMFILI